MKREQRKIHGVAGTSRTVEVICPLKNVDEDTWLTSVQKDALKENVNIHEPIEAYEEKWKHITDEHNEFVSAYPIPNTLVRKDLPPLTNQWKSDAKRRFGGKNG